MTKAEAVAALRELADQLADPSMPEVDITLDCHFWDIAKDSSLSMPVRRDVFFAMGNLACTQLVDLINRPKPEDSDASSQDRV